MTEQRVPLERLIAGWMADEATGAPEPLLEQILATTARTTPRPRVWALAAEPTLRGRSARAAVGLPNRGLVLAAVAGLVLAAIAALALGAALLLNQRPDEGGDVPGFRGDAARAASGLIGPVGNPVPAWQFQAAGTVFEVAVVGDDVYFASNDGALHAVSRDRGIEQWAVQVAAPPLSGPFAADGRLYLSDSKGTFHAYRIDDGGSVWSSAARYPEPSRAIAVGGSLYFGTGDGFVVALDAATGIERWRLRPPGATHVDAPAFADGRLFAGTDGAGFVAIDPAGPRVIWTGETGTEDTGSATVSNGIAWIGANAAANVTGTLHAFDAATGRALWTAADPALGMPTVASGVAYTTGVDGLVEALDATTGAARWRVRVDGLPHPAVVVGGVIYLTADGARRIEALDARTGNELWRYGLAADATCCVSVAKGMLFAGTSSGAVVALSGDGGATTARVLPTPMPTASPPPSPAASASSEPSPTPLPAIGTVTWSTDVRGRGFAPVSQIAVDPTSGRIWAPEANADRIAIFSPTGTLLEEWGESGDGPGQFDFTRDNRDGYGTLAFAKDGSFYVLDAGNHRVQQFSAARQFVREWGSFGDGPRQYRDPVGIAVGPDGSVWILDDVRSVVEHDSAAGKVLGSFDPFAATAVNRGANSLAIDDHGTIYVSGAGPNQVYVFDPDGTPIRVVGDGVFSDQAGDMAIDASGRLFATQGPDRRNRPGVLAFGADGSLIGGFGAVGGGDGQLLFAAGIALDGGGGLYVEDSADAAARLMKLQLFPALRP